MSEDRSPTEKPAAGWRIKAGAALFGMSILLPVAGVFRFYRPEPALFDKSWKLNDVEKL